jgi:hypothetical protein
LKERKTEFQSKEEGLTRQFRVITQPSKDFQHPFLQVYLDLVRNNTLLRPLVLRRPQKLNFDY